MAIDHQSDPSPARHRSDSRGLTIVLLEDDPADVELFRHQLSSAWSGNFDVVVFETVAGLEAEVGPIEADIVFCDLSLPDDAGLPVLKRAIMCSPAPIVVLTGSADTELPMTAITHGAQDYLRKGRFGAEDLARSLRYSMARSLAEAETRQTATKLTQLNRELDQFAGVIAHDLRAPLRTARLFADRLTAAVSAGEETDLIADALDSSLEKMELLIRHLLRLASIRDSTIRLQTERLAQIVDDVRAGFSADLRSVGGSLTCNSLENVAADPALLRELLRTLVANSIQYRDTDRTLHVSVTCRTLGSVCELTVTDNGVGVEPRFHQRIFGLFERLDSTGPTTSAGFGLALCRQIVDLHGGTITAGATPTGVGLAVQVRLPIATKPGDAVDS